MALFIKVHQTWFKGTTKETWINVNLITDMSRHTDEKWASDAKTEINMVSMDGENHPVVFYVTETIEELIECLQTRE